MFAPRTWAVQNWATRRAAATSRMNRSESRPGLSRRVFSSLMATRPAYQLGPVYPWTVAVANVIGSMFGIRSIGGYRAGPDAEDHELGLGLDFMVNADATSGRALAQFVQALFQIRMRK